MKANRICPKIGCGWRLPFAVLALSLAFAPLFGQESASVDSAAFDNSIDRTDPNFVKASLLIMGPGDELFSCAGHVCLRLECPTFGHDYCFSYESESVQDRLLTFFAGHLRMGMFATPTKEFLEQYEVAFRGVTQYELNLPADAKQRLWKRFDEAAAEGPNLPYDYIKRGCAQSLLLYLIESLKPYELISAPWPEKWKETNRETLAKDIVQYPWNMFAIDAIMGTEVDVAGSHTSRIVTPRDLLTYLQHATINGRKVIADDGVELFTQRLRTPQSVITPTMVGILFAIVSCIGLFRPLPIFDAALLLLTFVLGGFLIFLVCYSDLPNTTWNWLIVPFNCLPVIFWKWRRFWALPFGLVVLLWCGFMVFNPHRLTHPAYTLMAFACAVLYLKQHFPCPLFFTKGTKK